MVSQRTVKTLLLSAVALSISGMAGTARAETFHTPANPNLIKTGANSCQSAEAADSLSAGTTEKCYGVVKAGQNDCASADKAHSCAGMAAKNGDKSEWVALPAGLCDKLSGGSLKAPNGKS